MKATVSQDIFLSNDNNKSRLITMLKTKFERNGIIVKQHEEDADTLIVSTAFAMSQDYQSVVIVGEDTDLLIILTGTGTEALKNVYFLKPGKGKSGKSLYSYMSLKDPNLAEYILFLHAFTGCDSTSSIFNQGKLKLATVLAKNEDLGQEMNLFKLQNTDPDVIDDAGERILIALYGGRHDQDSLNKLRYDGFGRSITKSKFNLACLPPSKAAARQHSLRTYHQMQLWLGNTIPAESWGWKQGPNGLIPILTLQEPAPPELLKLVTCKCEKGCGKQCGCRKAGLKCSEICYSCHGQSCSNAKEIEHAESDSEDEEGNPIMERWRAQSNRFGQPLDNYQDTSSSDEADAVTKNSAERPIIMDEIEIVDAEHYVPDDGPSCSKTPRRSLRI